LDSSGSRRGPVAGCCEHGNEPSGSIMVCFWELITNLPLFVSYLTIRFCVESNNMRDCLQVVNLEGCSDTRSSSWNK